MIEFSRREYNFFLKIALRSNKLYFPLVLTNSAEFIDEIKVLQKDVWGIINQILENYFIENQIESHFKSQRIKICKNIKIKGKKEIEVSTLNDEEENPFFCYVQRVRYILRHKFILKRKFLGYIMILVKDEDLLDEYKKYFDTRRKEYKVYTIVIINFNSC